MIKKVLLVSFALLSLQVFAVPEAVEVVAEQMLADGAETASGETPETGLWVLAVGATDATTGQSSKDLLALASLDAKKALGAFLTTQIASVTEMSVSEDDDGLRSSFSRWAKTEVSELLKGVRTIKSFKRGDEFIAVVLLTEKSVDASAKLTQAMAKERPGTVEASGTGETKEAAIQAACRSALEQVCGTSIVASDAAVGESVRSRAFSDVQGMVSAYRILSSTCEDGVYTVTIVAEIDKEELQESYGAQLKSVGDPLFFLTSTNDDALSQMGDWFIGKGMKTTRNKGTSDYKIDILTKFSERKHPASGRVGVQLQMTVICYDKAGVQLFSLQNDPRKAAVFIGSPERQSQIAVEKAVKQIAKPLHERLQRAIADMVNNGRTVRMVFRNVRTKSQCAFIEQIVNEINDMPGASSATSSLNETVAVATLRFTLKGNPEDFVGLLRKRVPDLPAALSVSVNKIVFEF